MNRLIFRLFCLSPLFLFTIVVEKDEEEKEEKKEKE